MFRYVGGVMIIARKEIVRFVPVVSVVMCYVCLLQGEHAKADWYGAGAPPAATPKTARREHSPTATPTQETR